MRPPFQWRADELRTVLDAIDEGVFILDRPSLGFAEANRAGCLLLGYPRRELLGLCLSDVVADSGRARATVTEDLLRGELWQAKRVVTLRHRDGSDVPFECSIHRLESDPRKFLVLAGRRAGENREPGDGRLQWPSRDWLTGLPDRRALYRHLSLLAERAEGGDYSFAVLFVDVDYFKQVNDSMGHLAGDKALRDIAEKIVGCVRPVDVVTRYGGDEFVVILDNVRSKEEVMGVARRLSEAVKELRDVEGRRLAVSASVGISIGSRDRSSPDDLLCEADRAMYRAKALGRNGSCVLGYPAVGAPEATV